MYIFLFWREGGRARAGAGGGGRGEENLKQALHWAWSPMRGSVS